VRHGRVGEAGLPAPIRVQKLDEGPITCLNLIGQVGAAGGYGGGLAADVEVGADEMKVGAGVLNGQEAAPVWQGVGPLPAQCGNGAGGTASKDQDEK